MLNALTIDIEDYYHVTAFEREVPRHQWDDFPSRVVGNTHRLLDLLDRHQTSATFFVLGWVAHRHPDLVRSIVRAGHEVGCHSYWHRLIYEQTPEQFREDLKKAKDVLEDCVGGPVTAYRAPSFSITKQTLWALEILHAEGFRHDSSIFPIYHDRYGIPDAERFPHRLAASRGEMWEFPPSVMRFWRTNMPFGGGGYFRLFPLWWTKYCIRQVNKQNQPVVFYIHPWELDPEQPRMAARGLVRFRHYLNLARTEQRLEGLLQSMRFGSLSQVLHQTGGPETLTLAQRNTSPLRLYTPPDADLCACREGEERERLLGLPCTCHTRPPDLRNGT